jgi:hypothetical protein
LIQNNYFYKKMTVYVIGPTDPDDLGRININLCPYFHAPLATMHVQSVNSVANIEVLNSEDYIDFSRKHPDAGEPEMETEQLASATYWKNTSEDFKEGDHLENAEPAMQFDFIYLISQG